MSTISLNHRSVLLMLAILLGAPAAGLAQRTPDRSGFTLLLNVGAGYQHDGGRDESATGLAGLNFGIGGFLRDNRALMLRASMTRVDYESATQTSGVIAPTLQIWRGDRRYIEAGIGLGFWTADDDKLEDDGSENGFGLIIGAGYRRRLSFGLEYAPVFTGSGAVHNVGLVVGWQRL